jgi:hypothetical protein
MWFNNFFFFLNFSTDVSICIVDDILLMAKNRNVTSVHKLMEIISMLLKKMTRTCPYTLLKKILKKIISAMMPYIYDSINCFNIQNKFYMHN